MPRKPVPIDLDELEKLAALHCTVAEVAAWFGITRQSMDTKLRKEPWRSVWELGIAKGKISIRRKQKQLADAGDRVMLIWVGKQWLGQSDKQNVELTGKEGGAIKHEHDYAERSDDDLIAEAERITRKAAVT